MTITYVHLCCVGHSGSTLLSLLLGSHSSVVSLGEAGYLSEYLMRKKLCACSLPIEECIFWVPVRDALRKQTGVDIIWQPVNFRLNFPNNKHAAKDFVIGGWQLGFNTLAKNMPAFGRIGQLRNQLYKITENNFVLYDTVSQVTGRSVVFDTTKSIYRVKLLHLRQPTNFKIIYLVRDGRGVMNSYIKLGYSPSYAAAGWLVGNMCARGLLRTIPRSMQLFIRYEDLCADPKSVLTRVCEFIGIRFEESMIAFRNYPHHDISGNARLLQSPETEIINQETWRHDLSKWETRIFNIIGGILNRNLDYI